MNQDVADYLSDLIGHVAAPPAAAPAVVAMVRPARADRVAAAAVALAPDADVADESTGRSRAAAIDPGTDAVADVVAAPAADASAEDCCDPDPDPDAGTVDRDAAMHAFVHADGPISDEEFEALLDCLGPASPPAPENSPQAGLPDTSAHGAAAADDAAPDHAAAAMPRAQAVAVAGAIADRDHVQDPDPEPESAPTPEASFATAPAVAATAPAAAPARAAADEAAQREDRTPPTERRRRHGDQVVAWLRFRVRRQAFAVEVLRIQEVLRVPEIVPVRGAPPAIAGLMNLRGQLVAVMDLAQRLDLDGEVTAAPEDARVVVLESGGNCLGLRVDAVADVASIVDDRIERVDGPLLGAAGPLLRGVCRIDGSTTVLLDHAALLA